MKQKTIVPPRIEQQRFQELEQTLLLGVPTLVGASGKRIELPTTVYEVLKKAVNFMAQGQAVTLIPNQQAISTQRAADILRVSRPFFIKLLENGAMPHHRVGNQRRVYLQDILDFAKKRDQERLAALDRLSRDAFEAGLYDGNQFPQNGSDE